MFNNFFITKVTFHWTAVLLLFLNIYFKETNLLYLYSYILHLHIRNHVFIITSRLQSKNKPKTWCYTIYVLWHWYVYNSSEAILFSRLPRASLLELGEENPLENYTEQPWVLQNELRHQLISAAVKNTARLTVAVTHLIFIEKKKIEFPTCTQRAQSSLTSSIYTI